MNKVETNRKYNVNEIDWTKAPKGTQRAHNGGYVRWLKKDKGHVYYFHWSTMSWLKYANQGNANDIWLSSEVKPDEKSGFRGVKWERPNDPNCDVEVVMTLAEFKNLEDYKLRYEQLKDCENVTCVIKWPVFCSADSFSYSKHYFKGLLSEFDEMELSVNHVSVVDLMKVKLDGEIERLESENKMLRDKLRAKKWYQFWK